MRDVRTRERHRIVKRIRHQYSLSPGGAATLYVLHFTPPYIGHARHYIGFTGFDVESRLETHRSGAGSKLVRALLAHGGDFVLALAFKLSLDRARSVERRLKNNGSGVRICPLCAQTCLTARLATNRAHYPQTARARRRHGTTPAASPE